MANEAVPSTGYSGCIKEKAAERGKLYIEFELCDAVVKTIGALAGDPVIPDAPHRVGELCFKKAHKEWKRLTREGRHRLTQADHKRDNACIGSVFNSPVFVFPCVKENGGSMHTTLGHFNH